MAAANRGSEELHGLLGELLALGDALGRGQSASLFPLEFALFAIDLGPLSLVTWLEKRLAGRCVHVEILRSRYGGTPARSRPGHLSGEVGGHQKAPAAWAITAIQAATISSQ
jgi:hypothetical protein